MKSSKNTFFISNYRQIYVEKEALRYPMTNEILKQFPRAKIIEINHYQDIFGTSTHVPKLILTVKKAPFLYVDPSNMNASYHTSSMLNYYEDNKFPRSGQHIVLFVNLEDYFLEIKQQLLAHPVHLNISYESDQLPAHSLIPYVRKWIELAEHTENLSIALHTKKANSQNFLQLKASDNMILSFSVAPEEIITRYENNTPLLHSRAEAIRELKSQGFRIRLRLDPILYVPNWKRIYESCINQIFSIVDPESIEEISAGAFGIPKKYRSKIKRFKFEDTRLGYPDRLKKQMLDHIKGVLSIHVPSKKIQIP